MVEYNFGAFFQVSKKHAKNNCSPILGTLGPQRFQLVLPRFTGGPSGHGGIAFWFEVTSTSKLSWSARRATLASESVVSNGTFFEPGRSCHSLIVNQCVVSPKVKSRPQEKLVLVVLSYCALFEIPRQMIPLDAVRSGNPTKTEG